MSRRHELTGKVFGKWTVVNVAHKGKNRDIYWNVVCSCGQYGKAAAKKLVHGETTQCKICATRQAGRKGLYSKSSGDLYMIRVGEYIKIGSTNDIERRFKNIDAASPFYAEMVYHGVGEGVDEEFWHKLFSHRHHKGEWFYMPLGDYCEI